MKLVVQIPCFNEEETLQETVDGIPERFPGIDDIEIIVIDDGSTDNTVETAERIARVTDVVRLPVHRGLASAFMAGIHRSLARGADVIVNTDADNQYCGEDIAKLIKPILDGKTNVVIGNRQVHDIRHFSFIKKILQKLGSKTVNILAKREISDVTSGFRAFSRESATRLRVFSTYSYTLETILQLSSMKFDIVSVNIRTNPKLRKSRLMRSMPEYVWRSMLTIIKLFYIYNPFKLFFSLSMIFGIPGITLVARFFFLYFKIKGQTGHVQSLIIGLTLCGASGIMLLIGAVAQLITTNRKILEDIDYTIKTIQYNK
ncbi:MAG: glycosyltransferase family 2 protein [Elusimicrobia bacterium]|nr:glycosyltransferase family 2 protein [Elusimicrobiota bacterium]